MNTEKKLIALLATARKFPLAYQLSHDFPSNDGVDATGPISIRAARQIFRQRAKHIERTGYPITGFPELVDGLENFTADAVTIFNVRFDTGDYAVFADPALSELAGVLKFPKRTAAQEAALADSRRQEALRDASRLLLA